MLSRRLTFRDIYQYVSVVHRLDCDCDCYWYLSVFCVCFFFSSSDSFFRCRIFHFAYLLEIIEVILVLFSYFVALNQLRFKMSKKYLSVHVKTARKLRENMVCTLWYFFSSHYLYCLEFNFVWNAKRRFSRFAFLMLKIQEYYNCLTVDMHIRIVTAHINDVSSLSVCMCVCVW